MARVVSTLALLGAATPLIEIKTVVVPESFAISDCNLVTTARKLSSEPPANYLARVERAPAWLLDAAAAPPLTVENRKCWPDHPLLDDRRR